MEHQYWLVGATYGTEDQYDRFVNGGFWMLGWEEEDQTSQYSSAKSMKKGDRIAIKKRNGRGASNITIRSVGVIREVVVDNARIFCTVDWCAKDINRSVPSRGCFSSIHGPYSLQTDNDWIRSIFVL